MAVRQQRNAGRNSLTPCHTGGLAFVGGTFCTARRWFVATAGHSSPYWRGRGRLRFSNAGVFPRQLEQMAKSSEGDGAPLLKPNHSTTSSSFAHAFHASQLF
jgi:hypothetical protein